ncbi:MAG: PAS domain S-box protein [Spirochaetes bacterium]|nr:PAS domain S-box protein [Spirochaetota bacterium]
MASEISEEEARLRAILDTVIDGIIVIDEYGLIDSFNPAAEKIFGYAAAEVAGKNIKMLMPSPYREEHDGYLANYKNSGQAKIIGLGREVIGRRKNGSEFPMNLAVGKMTLRGRTYFTGIVSDITQRINAEEGLRKLSRAVEQSASLVMITDRDGNIEYVNRKFVEVTGYSIAEVAGKNPKFLKSGYLSEKDYEGLWSTIMRGEEWRGEFHNRKKNGELFWVLASISPIKDGAGAITHYLAIEEDITSLKEIQTELARSNAELQQFAYIASHDLQEPLRMIGSYVQLLARRYQDKLDASANEFIAFAVDGVQRMQTLINDLLAYSRVSTSVRDFQTVDCAHVLAQVQANLKIALEESAAKITAGPLPVLRADPTQIMQLFQNLINNAVKFRAQRPPEIGIHAGKKGDFWQFDVSDNGIGFDMQYADRIFVIFQRLNNRAEYAGTGIGLAVCKRIVERHGGKIWVDSAPGKGTTFHFTLPA